MDNRVASYTSGIENSEIESLQSDIGVLIDDINKFISVQPKEKDYQTDGDDEDNSEKVDGPSEKYEGNEIDLAAKTGSDICESSDESESEEEIDWSLAGPVLKRHIHDLERLHSLNVATSSLIRRLKKLTVEKSIEPILDLGEKTIDDI